VGRSILNQIIGGIAEVEGIDPIDLNIPLQQYVATDAIRDLVNHQSNAWRLQFETPDHVVEITGNDQLLIDGTEIHTLD
jgi:hypothetical protein